MSDSDAPLKVLVSVGTDHHPFDRLMDWVERWAQVVGDRASVVVQHGASRPPDGTTNVRLLTRDELVRHMSDADAVVLQGGPGGVVDSLRCGRRPIVVPRLVRLGEVVDDHQVAFVRHMEQRSLVAAAESEEQLVAALETVAADHDSMRIPPHPASIPPQTLERFDALVSDLMASPRADRRVAAR